jgi:hypothetical protein
MPTERRFRSPTPDRGTELKRISTLPFLAVSARPRPNRQFHSGQASRLAHPCLARKPVSYCPISCGPLL